MLTMKQVVLNVAVDPLMSLAYVGVKGGMVIVSADDPGPISSQTEQDTRRFADFCRIPVFDPSSPEEAFSMIKDAFEYSEIYNTPVLFRPTTRVCHAYASVETPEYAGPKEYEGFVKDSKKWVIFPRLSFANHAMIEKRNVEMGKDLSGYCGNTVEGGNSKKAVITSGISYAYTKEYLKDYPDIKLIKLATAYPFPEELVLSALDGVDEVICIEELSPFIEEQVLKLAGKHHLQLKVSGKLDGKVQPSGELSADKAAVILSDFLGTQCVKSGYDLSDAPALPIRPPVLCAGCPHRASFYAVKQAMKGRKAYFCGDIGCYTLGALPPFRAIDTCIDMGASITMAKGASDAGVYPAVSVIGDSTFTHSGMTGLLDCVNENTNITIVISDNETTAMTGGQDSAGTGRIESICAGIGVDPAHIRVMVPLKKNYDEMKAIIREEIEYKGVSVLIPRRECIQTLTRKKKASRK